MTVIDQQARQQISDLVNACQGYWELRGIAVERRAEMREELEQHLVQAVRDGKSLEAVVGSNALDFAESWAREMPHRPIRGFSIVLRWIALGWLPLALALLALIAVSEHVLFLSSSFAFTLGNGIVTCALIGLFTLLLPLTGFLSPRISSRDNRFLLAFGIYAVLGLLLILFLRLLNAPLHVPLFRWEWPVTLLLIVGALGLFGARRWLVRTQ